MSFAKLTALMNFTGGGIVNAGESKLNLRKERTNEAKEKETERSVHWLRFIEHFITMACDRPTNIRVP
jgi:hypothetical protein